MKKKTLKRKLIILALIAVYILMLVLLYMAEKAGGSVRIKTPGDAFWYSIVTLTTVGYGDVTPVTPMGRFIGIIFLLLSTGILVTLVGTIVSAFTGEALPLFLLRLQRSKPWYYFADYGPESKALAQDLVNEAADSVIIFGVRKNEHDEDPAFSCYFVNVSPARLVEIKKHHGISLRVFLMGENEIASSPHTTSLANLPVKVYARTAAGADTLSDNIQCFHSHDCCAREYWRSKPLTFAEKNIVLLGFGQYGQALLRQAIYTNILSIDQPVTYHIFGDPSEFLSIHRRLDQTFYINSEGPDMDSLIFHKEPWTDCHDLLAQADRIIICQDQEDLGWEIMWQLKRYYVLKGRIDLRCGKKAPGISCFGTDEEIYTANHILKTKLNDAAIAMNELYCRSHPMIKTYTWDELSDFLRQSKIAAADHLITKARILLEDDSITHLTNELCEQAYEKYKKLSVYPAETEKCRRIEHYRWKRFYVYNNWNYGPVNDSDLRISSMICSYEDLNAAGKKHQDFAWELFGELNL